MDDKLFGYDRSLVERVASNFGLSLVVILFLVLVVRPLALKKIAAKRNGAPLDVISEHPPKYPRIKKILKYLAFNLFFCFFLITLGMYFHQRTIHYLPASMAILSILIRLLDGDAKLTADHFRSINNLACLLAGICLPLIVLTAPGYKSFFSVTGVDMRPALEAGGHILVERDGALHLGDIIVFRCESDCARWGGGESQVARINGLAGDSISIKSGRLYVNDLETITSSFDKGTATTGYIVPDGHVLALKDKFYKNPDFDILAIERSQVFGPVKEIYRKNISRDQFYNFIPGLSFLITILLLPLSVKTQPDKTKFFDFCYKSSILFWFSSIVFIIYCETMPTESIFTAGMSFIAMSANAVNSLVGNFALSKSLVETVSLLSGIVSIAAAYRRFRPNGSVVP